MKLYAKVESDKIRQLCSERHTGQDSMFFQISTSGLIEVESDGYNDDWENWRALPQSLLGEINCSDQQAIQPLYEWFTTVENILDVGRYLNDRGIACKYPYLFTRREA